MDKGFALLEERVKKAVDVVGRLKRDNAALQEEAGRLKLRVQELEKAAAQAAARERAPSAEEARRTAGREQELKVLRQEREEIRSRISKLVDVLEALE